MVDDLSHLLEVVLQPEEVLVGLRVVGGGVEAVEERRQHVQRGAHLVEDVSRKGKRNNIRM